MSIEAMKQALEALENNRQTHHYCEDTWYSCPKHEDGCANDFEGDECNCGADKANAEIDAAITSLRQAIAEAEGISLMSIKHPTGQPADGDINPDSLEEIEIDLPKREWVGLTDEEMQAVVDAQPLVSNINVYFKAIEAKLKEKNYGV